MNEIFLYYYLQMDQGKGQINIYHEYEENGEFANFYHSPIIIEGKEYATTEHYYQAMKFYPNEDEVSIQQLSLDGRS